MINELCDDVHLVAHDKGFYVNSECSKGKECKHISGSVTAQLMLVVTELAESCEALRHDDMGNFSEELADACIRIFDIAASMNIDLEQAIFDKIRINKYRQFKHGKRF